MFQTITPSLQEKRMSPLERIIMEFAWVVGPRYDPKDSKRSIGYRAVKGWRVINLDDDAEEIVTVRADTPEELLQKVMHHETEQSRLQKEGEMKLKPGSA